MVNRRTPSRRGFSLPEVLIALTISAVLMLATLVALGASFDAYSRTAESVSTNVSGRLVLERVQMLIRGGIDFAPLPTSPTDDVVEGDELRIQSADGTWTTIRWDSATETLRWEDGVDSWPLLEGVTQDATGTLISPFRMTFDEGRWLTHATIDLIIDADGLSNTTLEQGDVEVLRFVGSAMPRRVGWQ